MAIAAVMTASFFNGLNTNVWTVWVFLAVAIGMLLVWVYTVSKVPLGYHYLSNRAQAVYSAITPGWFVTPIYGNNHYIFESPYFWFCSILTIVLSLTPRYLAKAYKFIFAPDDLDIMRWARKADKNRDFGKEAHAGGILRLRPQQNASRSESASRRTSLEGDRPAGTPSLRNASRTDMSTGLRSVHRGFDFATEESGPAMRRLQSNLSGVAPGSPQPHAAPERRKHTFSLSTLKRGLKKKRPSSNSTANTDRS